jgi:3-oxoacyl-[acyl-carrier-protein] synthase-3
MIEDLLRTAGQSMDDVDYFLFHQPNRFMLQKLAERMNAPFEKMPSNIVEHYGNSSGVTVPMVIAHNLRERLLGGSINACLAGFGVGLTWASMLMPLGKFTFCDLVDFQ